MMRSIPVLIRPLLSSEAPQCWFGYLCLKEEGLGCVPWHSWLKIAGKNQLVVGLCRYSVNSLKELIISCLCREEKGK